MQAQMVSKNRRTKRMSCLQIKKMEQKKEIENPGWVSFILEALRKKKNKCSEHLEGAPTSNIQNDSPDTS